MRAGERWANRWRSSAWRPPPKSKEPGTCPGSSPRVSASREDATALSQPPCLRRESRMSTTVSHPVPSAQAQAIADLTGYEDAATLRWQQACVQAAHTLTALPHGRAVNVRMERMRQGLELPQRGAVTLPEDGEQLSAVVRSGNNVYQVDTRLLTCTCAEYQKHLQACKHLLAVEV